MTKKRLNPACADYRDFIKEYLLQIIGIPSHENNIRVVDEYIPTKSPVFYVSEEKRVYFADYNKALFYVYSSSEIDLDNIKAAINIVQIYFKIARYKFDGAGTTVYNRYPSDAMRIRSNESAVQEGICRWIIGSNNPRIAELIHRLENWSVKTYEGKKVTFGFIINPDEQSSFASKEYGTWLDFLQSDYSATLTDCIHSAIMLDKNCDFVRYVSLTEGNQIQNYTLGGLPYRFAGIIQNHVIDKCIGIFLLSNGDILLSKNGELRFVKRNLKWLNVSFGAFRNAIKSYVRDAILQVSIYSSVLDVSFAHTGGIISIVRDIDTLKSSGVLDDVDYLLNGMDYSILKKSKQDDNPNMTVKEITPILLKRAAISSLIANNNFQCLDRKLRVELISMDGACIIDTKGNICASGAIIKNDSGSSEGGRGAAARKLSNYGIAIKISTDGYVEIFFHKKIRFSIK